jgi:hypothetical protein
MGDIPVDYSTRTDLELNIEVAKRLGITYRNLDELEVFTPQHTWVYKSWVTDTNAALELIKDDSNYTITGGGAWEVEYTKYFNDNYDHVAHVIRDNPARAICECWLRVQDAR